MIKRTDYIIRWTLAGIFCYAAIPKLLAPHDFAQIINAYGILPSSLLLPVALLLPLLELLFAGGIIFLKNWGFFGIGTMLIFFIIILSYAISQGFDIDCGCFGPEDPEHIAFNGLRFALIRDIIMLFFLAISMWYHRYRFFSFFQTGEVSS